MSTFRQKVQATTDWGKPDSADEVPQRRQKTAKRRSANRAEITGHRLFPAFAALWFAALFGLGSLAISSEVLGGLVTAIGLSALVPAAAPPLGFTAHLLVALLLTIVGGGLGLVLGLRLRPRTASAARPDVVDPTVSAVVEAGVPKVRARDAHPDAPPRRPLVITEAFGEPSDIAERELATKEPAIMEPAVSTDPLLRSKPGVSASDGLAGEQEPLAPIPALGSDAGLPPPNLSEIEDTQQLQPDASTFAGTAPSEPVNATVTEPAQEVAPAVDLDPVNGPDLEPDAFEPDDADASDPAEQVARVPTLVAATPQIPSGLDVPLPSRASLLAGEPWSPVAAAPLENLGLVQLIERLALAIAARKAASHAGPTPPNDGASPEVTDAECEAMPSESPGSEEPCASARDAIARRLGAVASHAPVVAAPAPFSRTIQTSVQAPVVTDGVVPMRPADQSVRPFAAPAAPVAADTSSPATAPFETDEALRSALATLQRMSARV